MFALTHKVSMVRNKTLTITTKPHAKYQLVDVLGNKVDTSLVEIHRKGNDLNIVNKQDNATVHLKGFYTPQHDAYLVIEDAHSVTGYMGISSNTSALSEFSIPLAEQMTPIKLGYFESSWAGAHLGLLALGGVGVGAALAASKSGGSSNTTNSTTTIEPPTLRLASDTGHSNADGLTQDGALALNTPAAGVSRVYSINGGAPSSSYTPPTNDGQYTVVITDTNSTGHAASSSITFTLDKTIATPTLALTNDTGTSSTDLVTHDARLSLSTAAADVNRTYRVDNGTANINYTAPTTSGTHTVLVTDTDTAGNIASSSLTFTVYTAVSPTITSGTNASVNENAPTSTTVYTATAVDNSHMSTGITYGLTGTDATLFHINPNTGVVTLKNSANFESKSSYAFTVSANDGVNLISTQNVAVNVNNIDEVAPTITSSVTATPIDENSGAGQTIYTATSTDSADYVSGSTTYSLKTGSDTGLSINSNTGAVTLTTNPDFETKPSYTFTVVATDAVGNSSEKTVGLAINNLDEGAPIFTSSTTATPLNENSGSNQPVYTASASDGSVVTYSLKNTGDASQFSIDRNTGVVTLIHNANFEAQSRYSFTVIATDAAQLASEQAVTLTINNLDEVAPTITSGTTANINENTTTATIVYTATATDNADISAGITYDIAGGDAALFNINPNTGAVTLKNSADFESNNTYSFALTANDGVNPVSIQQVTLTINNLDEIAPTITSGTTANINENITTAAIIYTATATDNADISAGITYGLAGADAALFNINSSTGAVTLKNSANFESRPSYAFVVTASDGVNPASTQNITLTINNLDEVAPTITSNATATPIDENSGAGQTIYTATSTDNVDYVNGSTTYSLKTGSDAGLSINSSTGAVTLTANPDFEAKPSYTFTVVATDAAGNSSEKIVSLTVNDLAEGPTAPLLVSAFPSDDMTNVLANDNIVLTFNENVIAGTGNIKLVNSATGVTQTIAITDTSQVHISGKYITINPNSNLTANANYHVLIEATAITNTTGIAYAGISSTTALNFSTVPVTSTYVDPNDSSALIGIEDSSDKKWGGALGQGVTLSYSFATSTTNNSYESGSKTVTSVLDDVQQTSFRTALQRWSEVANLNFVEVPDTGAGTGGIIRAAFADIGTSHGSAYYPTSHFSGGDVWLGQHYVDNTTYFTKGPTEPTGGMQTMIHEAGHGLALAHPNDNADDPNFSKLTTIMSYNTQDHSYVYLLDGTSYRIYDRTPMILDIAAMQTLYGANMAYNNTDTTYTFAHNDPFFMTLWDAGGNDTISITNLTKDSVIDLREGKYSSIRIDIQNVDTDYANDSSFYDGTNNLGIAYGAIIENAIGGSGNDTLIGNDTNNALTGNNGNDILEGGLGNDTLSGGAGIDMASYQHASAGVSIALHGDGLYNTAYGNDTFNSIEGLMGSDFNDALTGDSADNFIEGGLGDDTLDGGAGNDTATYLLATAGVTVALSTSSVQNTVAAGNDTLLNVENVTGSAYNDALTGSATDNVLIGGAGNDSLTGGLGHDTFKYANPDSSSIGGLGNDKIYDFKSNFDAIFDADEDVIDLSDFFSQKGIIVDATNVTHYVHMSNSTVGLMKIDTSAVGASTTAADSFLTLTGTSNIFTDSHLANLIQAHQLIL